MEDQDTEVMPGSIVFAPTPAALSRPTTPRALVLAEALKEDTEQRAILAEYVEQHMTEGVDYGAIPGTPQEVEVFVGGKKKKMRKNNLLKPGAEKLFDLFRCRPEYDFLAREVDRETGLYSYEMRCRAVNRETNTVLNEGVGSASSYESKHRYRNTFRVCPQCGKNAIIKGKSEFGGGWVCFGKKGGCGTKWPDGAAEIEGQESGKMVNPDLADVANTVLKMAKKRAQVDCAIALARMSDIFTQDVEDLPYDPLTRESRASVQPKTATPVPAKPDENKGAKISLLWEATKARLGTEEAKKAWSGAAARCADGRQSKDWTIKEVAAIGKFLELYRSDHPATETTGETTRNARVAKIREEAQERLGEDFIDAWADACRECADGKPSTQWGGREILAVTEYLHSWKRLPVEDNAGPPAERELGSDDGDDEFAQ
jgi:hypothetical protein